MTAPPAPDPLDQSRDGQPVPYDETCLLCNRRRGAGRTLQYRCGDPICTDCIQPKRRV